MMSTLEDTAPAVTTAAPGSRLRRAAPAVSGAARLTAGSGLGLGVAVLWLSLLVLIPLAAVVTQALGGGWSAFWANVTAPAAAEALEFTVVSSLIVAAINAVLGTLLAWIVVRDSFRGLRLVNLVLDVPFALPTIVAGLVLLSMYGPSSPVGINLLGTQRAIVVALLFVTLPFVVRSVQPVLAALDTETEQAAACLGAPPRTIFRRVVLPLLLPAIASGAALAFARAMGEYGSVLLISGGVSRTRLASMYAYQQIQNFDFPAAASVATVLLLVSLLVIGALDLLQHAAARRG